METIKRKKVMLSIFALVVFAALILVLTYPFYSGNTTRNADRNEIMNHHIYIDYSDEFKVDADLPESYNSKAGILNAKTIKFDDETIYSTLFKDRVFKKIVDESTVFYNDTKSTDDDPEHKYDYASLHINYEDLSFFFTCREYSYVNFIPSFFAPDYDYLPQMIKYSDCFTKKNLSFMSQEDAFKDVSGKMTDLGIDMPSNVEIYALDYGTLQSYWDNNRSSMEIFTLSKDERRTFTQDNECYVFCFRLTFDGIPVTHHSYAVSKNDVYAYGSDVKVFYSKNGIIGMEWIGIYDVDEAEPSHNQLISVQEALDKVFEAYHAHKSNGRITIEQARFEYTVIPDSDNSGQFRLIPSWSFVYSGNRGKTSDIITGMLHVNAVTGEVINVF